MENIDLKSLAIAIWNNLPYDNETCQPICPTSKDMENALKMALEKTGTILIKQVKE